MKIPAATLLLIAATGLAAEDVLNVTPSGSVVIAGSPPTAPTSSQVAIGGGRVATSSAFDSYFNSVVYGTWAADAVGPFIQWRQPGKTFSVYSDAGQQLFEVRSTPPAPGNVAVGQMVVGGGYIWSGAHQFNMLPATDVPIEIVNRRTNGGIDLYPNGLVKAASVTTSGVSVNGALAVTGAASAGNMTISRTTQAQATEVVRGDDPRVVNAISNDQKGSANGVAPLDGSGKIPAANLPIIESIPNALCWNTAGTFTWTVPTGWSAFHITIVGAGASGYLKPAQSSPISIPVASMGGQGGERKEHTLSLAPGSTLTFTIGTGGAGGGAPSSSRPGGNTSVTAPGLNLSALGGAQSGSTGFSGAAIYRSAWSVPGPVGNGGAAGGMGIGAGGAEVPNGQSGLSGSLGGGGSGPAVSPSSVGAGGNGCVIVQRITLSFMP